VLGLLGDMLNGRLELPRHVPQQVPAMHADQLRADRLLQAVRHQVQRHQQRDHQVDRRGDDQRAQGKPDRPHREGGEPCVGTPRSVTQPHQADNLVDAEQHEDHEPGYRAGQCRHA
jgi:hypothetical protein